MSAFDQVIRSAGERAALLARIAESQRSMDALCRGTVARLMAGDAYPQESQIRNAITDFQTWNEEAARCG